MRAASSMRGERGGGQNADGPTAKHKRAGGRRPSPHIWWAGAGSGLGRRSDRPNEISQHTKCLSGPIRIPSCLPWVYLIEGKREEQKSPLGWLISSWSWPGPGWTRRDRRCQARSAEHCDTSDLIISLSLNCYTFTFSFLPAFFSHLILSIHYFIYFSGSFFPPWTFLLNFFAPPWDSAKFSARELPSPHSVWLREFQRSEKGRFEKTFAEEESGGRKTSI